MPIRTNFIPARLHHFAPPPDFLHFVEDEQGWPGQRGRGLPDLAGTGHDLDQRWTLRQPVRDPRDDLAFDLQIQQALRPESRGEYLIR